MAGSLASGSLAAPTLAQLSSSARALANQSVAAQIAAVRSQQQQDLAQAQQRANSINAAALAASRYLQSLDLGGKAKADYQTAVGNQTGIASGYSGQLRSDADAAAKAAQASLASVPGNAQTVTDRGPSLANVLYGLGGAIPATQLNTVEPAAVQAARALTASPLGYGQQEAYGALGAGAQAAQGLAGQIANARAQEPTLTQSYLAQLSQAVRDQQLAQSLIGARTDSAGVAQQNANTAAANASSLGAYRTGSLSVAQQNANTRATAATKAATAKRTPTLSAKDRITYQGQANAGAAQALNGFQVTGSAPKAHISATDPRDGNPWSEPIIQGGVVVAYQTHYPQLPYAVALQHAIESGNPFAVKAVTRAYAPGIRAAAQAKAAAQRQAKASRGAARLVRKGATGAITGGALPAVP